MAGVTDGVFSAWWTVDGKFVVEAALKVVGGSGTWYGGIPFDFDVEYIDDGSAGCLHGMPDAEKE